MKYSIDYTEFNKYSGPYLCLTEVMKILHITYRTARRLCVSEGLKYKKWGGIYHIHKQDLVAYCAQKRGNRKRGFILPTDDPYFGWGNVY